MVRETPLRRDHLRTVTEISGLGAVIAPPVPAFYIRPEYLTDTVDHTAGRGLDPSDIDVGAVRRWKGTERGGVAFGGTTGRTPAGPRGRDGGSARCTSSFRFFPRRNRS
ncbi:hypothetical protein [Nocardiopsis halophila]|uniref:hypothetical protein n=1 Tax=Nocardiopsis halophila TaxID=141692 RepID=UPI00373AECBE